MFLSMKLAYMKVKTLFVMYSIPRTFYSKKKINCHVLLLFCFTLHLFHLFLLHSLVLHYYSLLPTGTFDLVPIEASVIY